MSTKTATKPATNGKATPADVAASIPQPTPIRPALASRIQDRLDDLHAAQEAVRAAETALDDMIALAREIEEPPAGWDPARLADGALAFVPPRPATPPPTTPAE